ncbi:DUF397 domain-containing protein [Lentzea sp. NPDC102401]|uniref:DUF397 domain-containing protein n=1 Tax=Lentzea sp. NPDC102401 TaxID=3364128 RepID=UPI003824374F
MSVVWRKSSRSNNGGNGSCVEIALNGSAARVRDSKSRTSSVVAAPQWAAFISAVKRGDFENN